MFCSNCGKELTDNVAFCPECGAAQQTVSQEEAPQAAPQDTPAESVYSAPQTPPQTTYQQPSYQQPVYQQNQYQQNQPPYQQQAPYQPAAPVDNGSFGWAVLGFFFPIVGLILFLVWKDQKPLSSKKAGIGALVGVILSVVFYVLVYVLIFGAAMMMY
ncbi:MAG: zinc ribbon domain-containing protein [Clostridia bacterium]